MVSRRDISSRIEDEGLIAIIRSDKPEKIPAAFEAVIKGGIKVLEVTLTTPRAIGLIGELSKKWFGEALIGVGSVTNKEQCEEAIQAGAEFVVSPVGKVEVLETAHRLGKPVMLGAYTPSEAQAAWEAGSDFIKIFPADKLGPSYIKALRAPLPHLKIIPTGGVDLNTARDFLNSGCAALGIGSSLFTASIMQNGNWNELSTLAEQYKAILQELRKG